MKPPYVKIVKCSSSRIASGLERASPPMDFRKASTIEKGHGRLDKRSIIVSNLHGLLQ